MRKKSILTLAKSLILVAMIFMLSSCGPDNVSGDYGGDDCGTYYKISFSSDGVVSLYFMPGGFNPKPIIIPATYTKDGEYISVNFSESSGGFEGRFVGDNFIYILSGSEYTCTKLELDTKLLENVARRNGPKAKENVVNKSNPDIDGTYSLAYKSKELPPERSLLLRLESGKAYTRLKGDPNQTEEVGDYRVVGNKITDASGRTEIFTLEDDGSMTIPNIPKDFRFIK